MKSNIRTNVSVTLLVVGLTLAGCAGDEAGADQAQPQSTEERGQVTAGHGGIGPRITQATFPGENGPILFRADDFETGLAGPLMRANPDGSDVTVINRRHAYFSDWRADGKLVAIDVIQRDLDTHIAVLEPDGSDFRFLTSGRGVHDSPSWSPNGRRLVFNHSFRRLDDPKFQTRLWTIRANGTHKRPLPMSHRGFDFEPKFSPDGRWIVFNRARLPNFDLAVFIVSTTGKHLVRRLTPWRINSEHPTWSPDGKWILFNNSPNGTIQAIRPNGEDRHTIVPASAGFGGHKPSMSPDGKHIVFMCENQGTLPDPPPDYNQDICVMDADGDDIVHITKTRRVYENYPAWGPACRNRTDDDLRGTDRRARRSS